MNGQPKIRIMPNYKFFSLEPKVKKISQSIKKLKDKNFRKYKRIKTK